VAAPCDPCGLGCRPFRPFGGALVNMKARLAAVHCGLACEPCEPVACEPCNPCDADCGGCRLPFNGFFLNLKAKMAASCCAPACAPAPCEPLCEPCAVCR
jgi:hypothetical protein